MALDARTIERIVTAAMRSRLYPGRRDRMLAGLAPELRGMLPDFKRPADQIRSDLEVLDEADLDAEGRPPLAVWMANGRFMAGNGKDAATFAAQWAIVYARSGLQPPVWRTDTAPAAKVDEPKKSVLLSTVLPALMVLGGIIGFVGVAMAGPSGAASAVAVKYGFLASLALTGLGISLWLHEFFGPSRLLMLLIAILATLTVGLTRAAWKAWPPADDGAGEPAVDEPLDDGSDPPRERAHTVVGVDEPPAHGDGERSASPYSEMADGSVRARGLAGADDHPTAEPARPRITTRPVPGLPGFVEVPPGDFEMGSPRHEPGRSDQEGPQHSVRFTRALWVQAHEVTQAEWRALMNTSPAYFDGCNDCPVERVNWFEAVAYANARSEAEGLPACYRLDGCGHGELGAGCAKGRTLCHSDTWQCSSVEFSGLDCAGYRLPTEAEWEYVARAGSTGRYASGEAEAGLDRLGWYRANSGGRTREVGTRTANEWGLSDLHGNVFEWCHDWYGSYSHGRAIDPTGPRSGAARVNRGGSFLHDVGRARSAYREGRLPSVRDRWVGFRLVRAPRAP